MTSSRSRSSNDNNRGSFMRLARVLPAALETADRHLPVKFREATSARRFVAGWEPTKVLRPIHGVVLHVNPTTQRLGAVSASVVEPCSGWRPRQ